MGYPMDNNDVAQFPTEAPSWRKIRRSERRANRASARVGRLAGSTTRSIKLASWEGNRSPSRLGRMGERAQQLDDVVNPLSRTVVTIAQMVVAVMDAVEHYERFRGRNDTTGDEATAKSESEETHTTAPKAGPTEAPEAAATEDDDIFGLESAPS